MIAPSITFDDTAIKPLWHRLSLEDVQELICNDVAELTPLYQLRAEAEAGESTSAGLVELIRLRSLIDAWEHAQDEHWSWYKEIQDVRTRPAARASSLGDGVVGAGY